MGEALKEWRRLDNITQEQFKAKLADHVLNPKVTSARLLGTKERCKIKLWNADFHLTHEGRDMKALDLLVAVRKHE